MSATVLRSFSPARLDALKEVASIGAGHAATALSLMTGARIMIDVPMVNVGQLSELVPAIADPDAHIVSVTMDMSGSLNGQTLLALPVLTGRRLADLMLRRERRARGEGFDRLEESALKEAGNILGGAYMTARDDPTGQRGAPALLSLALARLPAMSAAALSVGRPDAARRVADVVLAAAGAGP